MRPPGPFSADSGARAGRLRFPRLGNAFIRFVIVFPADLVSSSHTDPVVLVKYAPRAGGSSIERFWQLRRQLIFILFAFFFGYRVYHAISMWFWSDLSPFQGPLAALFHMFSVATASIGPFRVPFGPAWACLENRVPTHQDRLRDLSQWTLRVFGDDLCDVSPFRDSFGSTPPPVWVPQGSPSFELYYPPLFLGTESSMKV